MHNSHTIFTTECSHLSFLWCDTAAHLLHSCICKVMPQTMWYTAMSQKLFLNHIKYNVFLLAPHFIPATILFWLWWKKFLCTKYMGIYLLTFMRKNVAAWIIWRNTVFVPQWTKRYKTRQLCLTFASRLYGVMFIEFNILRIQLLIRLKKNTNEIMG